MKRFSFVPVKRCLPVLGGGLFALALVACQQQQQQKGETPPPVEPVVEQPARPVKPVVKPLRPQGGQKEEPKVKPVVPPADEAPSVFPPVTSAGVFVPSAPGKRISHVNVPGPYVAVTFDDGPSPALTSQVLDIFNRHGARATFFVLGQRATRNRGLLARAVAEGHEVGAHTWSHINMRASSMDKVRSELDRTNAVIEEATGRRPKVMRPPYGSINPQLVNMVYNRYGTPAILWDVDTKDWRKPGVQTVINRAVGWAKPGSIILLHDIHPSTIAAVEGVVTGLQARGFKLVTVSELIAMGRQAAGSTAPVRELPATPTPEPAPEQAGAASLGVPPAEAPLAEQAPAADSVSSSDLISEP